MKRSNRNKLMAVTLGVSMVLGMAVPSMAADDILRIDGKTGKIYVQGDAEGYNYGLKYLYDVVSYKPDWTDSPTLREVLEHLSTGRNEKDTPRVDTDAFINSPMGERTAELNYSYSTWRGDQMNEGLVAYWARNGLLKEAFYDADNGDIEGDYFVYSPTQTEQPEAGYPMVVLFHGGGEVAYQTETFGFCQIAAREGAILVAADTFRVQGDTDEEAYANMNAIIDKVEAEYPVDTTRVYVVGSSMGGANAMGFSISNIRNVAAVGVMDQPTSLSTRMWQASENNIADMQELGLPMVYVGGTADMYGLCGTQDYDFWDTSEGGEDTFIDGWNNLMTAFGVEGKELTAESRRELIQNPTSPSEQYAGYSFDVVEDLDESGLNPTYKCTMDGVEDLELIVVVNRPHMPSGFDAENIWAFISQYSRNAETNQSEKI